MNYNKTITAETQDNTEDNDVCYKKKKENYRLFTKDNMLSKYIAKKRKIIIIS